MQTRFKPKPLALMLLAGFHCSAWAQENDLQLTEVNVVGRGEGQAYY